MRRGRCCCQCCFQLCSFGIGTVRFFVHVIVGWLGVRSISSVRFAFLRTLLELCAVAVFRSRASALVSRVCRIGFTLFQGWVDYLFFNDWLRSLLLTHGYVPYIGLENGLFEVVLLGLQ
ncbi:hypothetical protein D3C71_1780970 [compost metagenome]